MAKRTVVVKGGTGKLRGRHCVKVKLGDGDKLPPLAKNAKRKGTRLSANRFYGCYVKKADAEKAATKLRNARRI